MEAAFPISSVTGSHVFRFGSRPSLQTPQTADSSARVSLEWTVPEDPKTSSHVRDSQGDTLYFVKSPRIRKTVITDQYGDIVAKIKFFVYCQPTIEFNRDPESIVRIHDWIRFSPELE